MIWFRIGLVFIAFQAAGALNPKTAAPAEPLLARLPAGVFLVDSSEASDPQLATLAQRLGGEIDRVTNSHLRVHGRRIQLNVVTTPTSQDAQRIHRTLAKNKSAPFCFRQRNLVIEYVGQNLDEALATKTSYELGFIEKPEQLTYEIDARLAAIDKADYMACNPIFQQFISLERGGEEAEREIRRLAKRFVFGESVALRSPMLYGSTPAFSFVPKPSNESKESAQVRFRFENLPSRSGVPYVTANLKVTVDDHGVFHDKALPTKLLTAPTERWPADQADIRTLARRITQGKKTNDEKAQAILKWLAPGTNLQYRGQTGSRWGTAKVLSQGYGHCWDFSDCFVTLARAADVPCRQVAGWLYGSSGHVWAEYYREGVGWQQVDPTGGGELRCGIYHIAYFTSDDGEMPIVYLGMPNVRIVSRPGQ